MGREAETTVRLEKQEASCKVQLETGEIVVHGTIKRRFPFSEMADLSARAGQLTFIANGEAIAIDLGDNAEDWLSRIRNPRTRSQKLGLKPGLKVCVLGAAEPDILSEIKDSTGAAPSRRLSKVVALALLFVEKPEDLSKLAKIEPVLDIGGAVWVLFPKGRRDLRHEEAVEAARSANLVQTKSMAFSERLTGIRFCRPAKKK